MTKRKDMIRMVWRDDDSIRFYRDRPDKPSVSEMTISNTWGTAFAIVSGNVGNVLIEL